MLKYQGSVHWGCTINWNIIALHYVEVQRSTLQKLQNSIMKKYCSAAEMFSRHEKTSLFGTTDPNKCHITMIWIALIEKMKTVMWKWSPSLKPWQNNWIGIGFFFFCTISCSPSENDETRSPCSYSMAGGCFHPRALQYHQGVFLVWVLPLGESNPQHPQWCLPV